MILYRSWVLSAGTAPDVGGDDIGFQLLGQIQYPLGFLDESGVLRLIGKALAQIAAQGRNPQPVGTHQIQKFPSLSAVMFSGAMSPDTAYTCNPCAPSRAAFFTPSGILTRKQSTMTPIGNVYIVSSSFI